MKIYHDPVDRLLDTLEEIRICTSHKELTKLIYANLTDPIFKLVFSLMFDSTFQFKFPGKITTSDMFFPQNFAKYSETPDLKELLETLVFVGRKQSMTYEEFNNIRKHCAADSYKTLVKIILSKGAVLQLPDVFIDSQFDTFVRRFPIEKPFKIKPSNGLPKDFKFPAQVQVKEPGVLTYAICRENSVTLYTSQGTRLVFPDSLIEKELLKNLPKNERNMVITGVLQVTSDPYETETWLNRLFYKKRPLTAEEEKQFHFIVWDYFSENEFWLKECKIVLLHRFQLLERIFLQSQWKHCSLIEYSEVKNMEEALEFTLLQTYLGAAGAIIKAYNAEWKSGVNPYIVNEDARSFERRYPYYCNLRITDFDFGINRGNAPWTFSNFFLQTDDGEVYGRASNCLTKAQYAPVPYPMTPQEEKEVSDYFLQNIKGKVVTISYFTINTRLFRGGTYQIPFVLSMDYTNLDSTDTRESILRNFVHE